MIPLPETTHKNSRFLHIHVNIDHTYNRFIQDPGYRPAGPPSK